MSRKRERDYLLSVPARSQAHQTALTRAAITPTNNTAIARAGAIARRSAARKEIVQKQPAPRDKETSTTHEKYFVPLALITFIHGAAEQQFIWLEISLLLLLFFFFSCVRARVQKRDVDVRAPTLCESGNFPPE
jgi:hypothetical protein